MPLRITRNFRGAKDRKSTRLNSSHVEISYAVFCLKKKKTIFPTSIDNPQLRFSVLSSGEQGLAFRRESYSPDSFRVSFNSRILFLFFFNDTATTEIYTLSLHDALPIPHISTRAPCRGGPATWPASRSRDRKSTRLNSSHVEISYAVFCLKKKKKNK